MGVYDYHHDSGKSDRPNLLHQNEQESESVNPYKAYVEVVADFSPDGKMVPMRIVWEDGRKYDIDRVLRIDRRASLKAGGAGIRYVCRVMGKQVELYYEENGLWFVTRRTPLYSGGRAGEMTQFFKKGFSDEFLLIDEPTMLLVEHDVRFREEIATKVIGL